MFMFHLFGENNNDYCIKKRRRSQPNSAIIFEINNRKTFLTQTKGNDSMGVKPKIYLKDCIFLKNKDRFKLYLSLFVEINWMEGCG